MLINILNATAFKRQPLSKVKPPLTSQHACVALLPQLGADDDDPPFGSATAAQEAMPAAMMAETKTVNCMLDVVEGLA